MNRLPFGAACREMRLCLFLPGSRRSHHVTGRAVRGMTLTGAATPIWFVTFEIRKRGILPKQRSPRETRTFATEGEAKIFARSKLEEGLTVFAGTINPHYPNGLSPPRISTLGSLTKRATSRLPATIRNNARFRALGLCLSVAILLRGSCPTQTTLHTAATDLLRKRAHS